MPRQCPTMGVSALQGDRKKFPFALYDVLQKADERIISWQPNGCCFMVRDVKQFVDLIMPSHLALKKLVSFQKQLANYGFERITSGKDCNAYTHRLFMRDHPNLLQYVNLKPKKVPVCKENKEPDASYRALLNVIKPVLQKDARMLAYDWNGVGPKVAKAGQSYLAGKVQEKDITKDAKPLSPPGIIAVKARQVSSKCGPLRVPGRLRPQPAQPAKAPVGLRFVPLSKPMFQQRQTAARPWKQALQLKPISTQLVGSDWSAANETPVSPGTPSA